MDECNGYLYEKGVFLMYLGMVFELRHQFDRSLTFDSDVLRRRFFHRWKARTLSFPSVPISLNLDITVKSYGRIELVSQYQETSTKRQKSHTHTRVWV